MKNSSIHCRDNGLLTTRIFDFDILGNGVCRISNYLRDLNTAHNYLM